jgi:hypothetical protein
MVKKELRQSLLEKGWTETEVNKALDTLYSEDKTKQVLHAKKMNRVLYWSTLVLVIIANTLVSIVMVPILLVMSNLVLYFIIAVLGLTFGALFNLLIRDIENIDPRHHVIAGIFLPAIAVVNIYSMVTFSNKFGQILQISHLQQNPWIVSLVYVVAFLLPYVIDQGFLQKMLKR